ncbi:MAG: hypothetical protein JXB62_01940 [Pirellulales bacterium]|nr:hypothetical protein [Pirellulales bacterium]
MLHFHVLWHTGFWHTGGVWLAKEGAHPKTVQSVRHSTITLTMDTYGHLFPGQAAAAVHRFPVMV